MEFTIQISCSISLSVYALLFFKLAWQTFFVNAFHYLADNFVFNLHDSVLLTTVIIKWFKNPKTDYKREASLCKNKFYFQSKWSYTQLLNHCRIFNTWLAVILLLVGF